MTTQSEQDELRREVARIFKYYTVAASAGLNATRAKTVIDAEKSLNECTEAVAHLLHQRELSLLAEVEKLGPNNQFSLFGPKLTDEMWVAGYDAANLHWRQTLKVMREERL